MCYIGIDLGGMSAKAGIFKDNKLLCKQTVITNARDGFLGVAEKLAQLARSICEKNQVDFSSVEAIGIGSPGVINSEKGVVVKWGNYNWDYVELGKTMEELTGKKVFITNDANAAALGEAMYGAGNKYQDSVLLTLGTGVGSGIVIGGKLFEGFRSAGGELGHTVIEVHGKYCGCGRKGCLEQYASATALIRMTRERMEEDTSTMMWDIAEGNLEKVDGKTAFEAAKMGDKVAKKIVEEYICYLANGIANIVNIIRPEAIIIGGGVSNQGENLMVPLRVAVEKRIYVDTNYAPLALITASLGNEAGIYGAYAYAVQRNQQ